MRVVARIEKVVQISPDDYRTRPVTTIFDSSASLDTILAWARLHGCDYLLNDIELTQVDREET